MHRTRLNLLANVGHINCAVDPAAPEGGSTDQPQEGATDDQATDEPKGGAEEKPDESGNDFDTLPSWAQAEIKSLRNESGRYRTANKELTEQLKGAKSQDDIDAARKEYEDKVTALELDLARATYTSGLAPEQLALVHGNTPEEIEASAKAVREAFAALTPQSLPSDVDGGLNPGASGGELDPRRLAREALRRR